MNSIDINCDLGESNSAVDWATDLLLMPYISSANIACGGHAGNDQSMATSIQNCLKHNLKIGAHPSFPDQINFGRIAMDITDSKLQESLAIQLQSFKNICSKLNAPIHHVKPHGALYNLAAKDSHLAMLISETIATVLPNAKIMGLADSKMQSVTQALNIDFISEGFMDRLYHQDASLVSRNHPLAVHQGIDTCLQQAFHLATSQSIATLEGKDISLKVDSICLHGDTANAIEIAQSLHRYFKQKEIQIQ